ncbi:MAG: zinc ribbon domain-containing protein [Oscillospiraceae bacterium]|nr:zinc ribbon domain-containing protein [Oscillospiraceae bacterium]
MFCTKCGASLPAGTNFCPHCGTKLNPYAAAPARSAKAAPVPECSEKNQLMVRVPGKGVYFIVGEERLCFYDGDTEEVAALTKFDSTVRLCGLGYYGGKLYYWHECLNERSNLYGMRLYERDVDTGAQRVVWETDEELFRNYRLDDHPAKARAILYDGAYYLLDYEDQSLMEISLPDGGQENYELPDMRQKLPLYDWMKPRGIVDIQSDEENFGVRYTGLDIVDGMVYLSLDGREVCTLRFPIDEPEKVNYLPTNGCASVRNDATGGMLTSVSSRVFSCPGYAAGGGEMCVYEIKADGNLVKMISNLTGGVSLNNKGGYWWRLGNTVYIGEIALNIYERKWHKLSPLLFDRKEHRDNVFGEVKDFVPGRNGAYLLTGTGFYYVPADWESKVKSVSDIEQFRIAKLKSL